MSCFFKVSKLNTLLNPSDTVNSKNTLYERKEKTTKTPNNEKKKTKKKTKTKKKKTKKKKTKKKKTKKKKTTSSGATKESQYTTTNTNVFATIPQSFGGGGGGKMMGKTPPPERTTSPVSDHSPLTRRRRKRKTKGDDCTDDDDGNDDFDDDFDDVYDDDKKGFVDEIAKRVKLCASITGRADDAKDDEDEDEDAFATVLASTSSYAEMNSVLKRVHFEAKERWERRRATRAEADGMK